ILIAPTQVEAARRLVSSLPAGFPFIYFDSHIPKTGALSSVIQDSRNSGTVAARLMRLLVPGEEEVQILRFLPSDYHLEQRIKGFCKYFCGNGKKEIEILDIPGHYSGEVLAEMLDTHFSGQFPRGIFVINSKIFEVADYLSNRGLGEQVALVGYDLIPQNIKFLKQGVIDFLISQSPELQGYTGLISLYRHLMFQESIDLEIRLPIEIITKENVDSYASTRSLDAFGQKVSMIYSD
ncbi:MAG TPA: substrate-binding domain-containing protein, partial [Calditrichia bacterium]|nr:substrate-binding domain-containing protein [Calditrichia bacterium]